MMDKSRVLLCSMVFCVCLMNPFGPMVGDNNNVNPDTPASFGRSILSADKAEMLTGFAYNWFTYMIHALLFLMVLVRIFIYGESSVKMSQSYWMHKKQAEKSTEKSEVKAQLAMAASALGRPVPTSKFEWLTSGLWQLIHQILHRLGITRWFSNQAGGIWADVDKKTSILVSRREGAMIYHQLHKLAFFEEGESSFKGLVYGLTAVNLIENSGSSGTAALKVNIYAHLALRLRSMFPPPLNLLARFYMHKAKKYARGLEDVRDPNLDWLLSPNGQRFFRSSWMIGQDHSLLVQVC